MLALPCDLGVVWLLACFRAGPSSTPPLAMQAAADTGDLAQRHVAMLVDRMLMLKDLPQRYGAQLTR